MTTHDTTSLFREHGAFAWRVLRRLGVAERDASDVCQEVFMVVHRKLGEFEGRSQFRTWIYGICVRTAADYRKRAVQRYEVLEGTPPETQAEQRPDDELARSQARALLDRALDSLDDDKRAVFVLYEIEELSMKEVAESLECPLQTAYSRLHVARELMTSAVRRIAAEEGARA